MSVFEDGLIHGFLSSFSLVKRADSEVLEGVAAGAAMGGGFGSVLPLLLGRFSGRVPSRLLDKQITTHMGALLGGFGGGFFGEWLPQALQQGQEGFHTGRSIFSEKTEKQAQDEVLKGVGLGGLAGAAVASGTALPILFGRIGRRLPTRVLNKMLVGRALSGAAVGGASGGLASKQSPRSNLYHYYYHKQPQGKDLGG